MKSVLMVTSLMLPNFSKYSCSSAMDVSQLSPPMNIFLVSSSSLVESIVSRAESEEGWEGKREGERRERGGRREVMTTVYRFAD